MQIKDIIEEIELFAPINYQESYDNCGLQVGNADWETDKVLLALDCTEEIVEEAIALNCNFIIVHHPLIFKGIKSLTGKNYVERTILKAIQNNIAIYAAHTNMDNMMLGVNNKIADKLNLINRKILQPTEGNILKLHTYVPLSHYETVSNALFAAGAGAIGNYYECGFSWEGEGTFRADDLANPFKGEAGGARVMATERKLEVILPNYLKNKVLTALIKAHPYEEVAYGFIQLANKNQTIGAGMIGDLETPAHVDYFLEMLKEKMQTDCIRHTKLHKSTIQKVAVCGGSGSFLLAHAIRQQADIFITGDFKYHEFFDAENKIIIADIGHYESEQFTIEIFSEIIKKKFRNFATLFTKHKTNPINYYF